MDPIAGSPLSSALVVLGLGGLGLFALVATAIWVMLPAYLPNNVAVVAGGGAPIDGGRRWRGRRLLGDGKTWRGTAVGTLAGVLAALLLNAVRGPATSALGVPVPGFPTATVLALPLGAMLGDIAASFLKRRTGRERGASFPLVDQLDFAVGALLLAAVVAPSWFVSVFSLPVLAVVLLLTPLLHLGTNAIGYALGLKGEPW